jgi:hypothetical protein
MELKYVVSADFGQINDYTAVAVTERRIVKASERYQHVVVWRDWPYGPDHRRFEMRMDVEQAYDLIRLDRVPLRTSYSKIASGIINLLKQLYKKQLKEEPEEYVLPYDHEDRITVGLAIDEGGVGKAIRDMLIKEAKERLTDGEPHVRFLPATVHGGANTSISGGFWHVPKRDLVNAGLIAYQNEKLRVGKLRYRDVLEEELANYRLKQNLATGHAAFEPLRENQHDDLVFAVCLGCWAWERAIKQPEYVTFPGAYAYS